ncbi:MAG: universal stress protein [Bacillota bacterium]|uniref:universal stress protein n=1 Tax=unclassified Candidatus Desulforudis TaxID=2635950 RepID=UPI00349B003B
MLKKILLPTDGSDHSLRAAEYVAGIMKERPALQVTLLNVYQVLPEFATYDSPVGPTGAVASLKEMSRRALERTKKVFDDAGLTVRMVSKQGDPGREIVAFARKGDYDHIVIGSRGTGTLKGLVFGSVVNKVLHLSAIPVIIIK